MAKEIKMSDIAKELGVSTVTVSKALSGQKGVSEGMRQKIKDLAKEKGYQSPTEAREEKKESFNIGVLLGEIYIEKYQTFYWEFYQEITRQATEKNCFVILEVLKKNDEKFLNTPRILTENKVDAVMVLGEISTAYLKALQEWSEKPVLYMDFYNREVAEDAVLSNNYFGSYFMTNYLFDMGHEKIGFVGTINATASITDRYMGYVKSLIEHGKSIEDAIVIKDREDAVLCYEEIDLPDKLPNAFVCNCDLAASQMMKALKKRGLRVPEDVSLVGYDDYLIPGLCDIGITTYGVDMNAMAKKGIECLVEKITGRAEKCGMQIVEGEMVIRGSVKQR